MFVEGKHKNIHSVVLLVAIAMLAWLVISYSQQTQAQPQSTRFRNVFERILAEGMVVSVDFVIPIDGVRETIGLPTSFGEGESEVFSSISEIGDDYLCIELTSRGSKQQYCTPYTNIVGVVYDSGG
jgi:hypothetical protein